MGPTTAVRYISSLRGSTQPVLVEASDGFLYVLKFANSPQGINVPFYESAGSVIYQEYGLCTPKWKPLLLTDAFVDSNPDCWMRGTDGAVRPAAGFCFGSRYLGTPNQHLFEVLPGSSYPKVQNRLCFWLAWAVDVCAKHTDNRQAVFVTQPSGRLQATFIDHGQMFGRNWEGQTPHMIASRYLDARIYPCLTRGDMHQLQKRAYAINTDKIWRIVQSLPEEWKTPTALYALSKCLNTLATVSFVSNSLENIYERARIQTSQMKLTAFPAAGYEHSLAAATR